MFRSLALACLAWDVPMSPSITARQTPGPKLAGTYLFRSSWSRTRTERWLTQITNACSLHADGSMTLLGIVNNAEQEQVLIVDDVPGALPSTGPDGVEHTYAPPIGDAATHDVLVHAGVTSALVSWEGFVATGAQRACDLLGCYDAPNGFDQVNIEVVLPPANGA